MAEIGDDRTRFATAGGLEAYGGSAPITPDSGKCNYVGRRFVKNNRLNYAGYPWAFATLSHSLTRRQRPLQAQGRGRRLVCPSCDPFNRMLGQLHQCLQNRVTFDVSTAFPPPAAAG
ncbi:transposase [Streptomyces sp. NPDC059752]|uniref:transposase n=1 Tax=unclassified Streptomyces TaxID=2593676 RepID=UPI00365EEBF2